MVVAAAATATIAEALVEEAITIAAIGHFFSLILPYTKLRHAIKYTSGCHYNLDLNSGDGLTSGLTRKDERPAGDVGH